jgi:hypothetical protein
MYQGFVAEAEALIAKTSKALAYLKTAKAAAGKTATTGDRA